MSFLEIYTTYSTPVSNCADYVIHGQLIGHELLTTTCAARWQATTGDATGAGTVKEATDGDV